MSDWNFGEWVEKIGHESLKEHIEHAGFLLTQANHLLLILLAGTGGGIGLSLTLFAKHGFAPLSVAIMGSTAWFAVVAVLLTKNCIATKDTWPLYTEPSCLKVGLDLGMEPMQIREAELANIQERITNNRNRNRQVATWLDRCRYATAATPLIAVISFLAAVWMFSSAAGYSGPKAPDSAVSVQLEE